jgi:hypothetical protein
MKKRCSWCFHGAHATGISVCWDADVSISIISRFPAARMAAQAVGNVADSFFLMLRDHAIAIVLVAPVTRVRTQAVGMACAATSSPAVPQREGMREIERGRSPGGSRVTGGTVGAEQTGVIGGIGVTCSTRCRQRGEFGIQVTALAGESCMCAGQREGGEVMIESHIAPGRFLMTGLTPGTVSTIVLVLFGMAAVTRRFQAGPLIRDVAGLTS